MSAIAFKPEEAREALKEYDGQIIAVDYAEEPFGMAGAPGIERRGKVLCVKIKTDQYDKAQYEWYPPSKVKKTKWIVLLEALTEVGAMKDIKVVGATDEERMLSFADCLLGMKFKWEEREFESLVKAQGGGAKKFSVLVPTAYIGKLPIEKEPEVRQSTIAESVK